MKKFTFGFDFSINCMEISATAETAAEAKKIALAELARVKGEGSVDCLASIELLDEEAA